jgi:hypothetical protein
MAAVAMNQLIQSVMAGRPVATRARTPDCSDDPCFGYP